MLSNETTVILYDHRQELVAVAREGQSHLEVSSKSIENLDHLHISHERRQHTTPFL